MLLAAAGSFFCKLPVQRWKTYRQGYRLDHCRAKELHCSLESWRRPKYIYIELKGEHILDLFDLLKHTCSLYSSDMLQLSWKGHQTQEKLQINTANKFPNSLKYYIYSVTNNGFFFSVANQIKSINVHPLLLTHTHILPSPYTHPHPIHTWTCTHS